MENRQFKENMIRLEIVAVIDGGFFLEMQHTVWKVMDHSYFLHAYDKIMSLLYFIENPQWPNVDSVIESIVRNPEAPDQRQ